MRYVCSTSIGTYAANTRPHTRDLIVLPLSTILFVHLFVFSQNITSFVDIFPFLDILLFQV